LKQGKKSEAIEELIVSATIDTDWNQDYAPEAFKKVVELDPKDFRGHRGLGYAKLSELTQWRDYDQAVEYFDKALLLKPNDVDSLKWRGMSYVGWEKYAPAIADFTKAILLKPTSELYTLRSEAYEKSGKALLAAADKKKAAALSPEPAMERAAAARRSGNLELAIQEYTKAIQLGSATAYRERGKAYMRTGKDDLALADFKEARIWNNEDFDIELGRGEIYARRGEYERASSAYQRVVLHSKDETMTAFAREKRAEVIANLKAQRK
jgi:tetratricopeptide (TPR) repeat protein